MVNLNSAQPANSAMSTFTHSWYRNLCGLLPVTQPPNGARTGLDAVREDTRVITDYLISEFVKSADISVHSSFKKTCVTMKTLVTQVMETEGKRFTDLTEDIDIASLKNDPRLVLDAVLDSMFEDGRIHWLRIVAAYVFAINLARRCTSEQDEELGKDVVRSVGEYLCNENMARWILSEGGWVSIYILYTRGMDKFTTKMSPVKIDNYDTYFVYAKTLSLYYMRSELRYYWCYSHENILRECDCETFKITTRSCIFHWIGINTRMYPIALFAEEHNVETRIPVAIRFL